MNNILNFGSVNIDMVYSVPHFVRAGETLAATRVQHFPGGKGLNQSIALSLAGGKVFHAGKIGSDGLWLSRLMESKGVDIILLDESGSNTGTALIQVDEGGQNCILLNHGANFEISPAQIEKTFSQFSAGDLLVLQNEINSLPEIIAAAKSRGMTIALNPSPIDEALLGMDLSDVSYLLLNEIEGEAFTGETEPRKICDALRKRLPKAKLILTLGEDGAFYCDETLEYAHGIYKTQAVDTTAAGDTFTGFFLSSVMSGKSAQEALRLASIASSIAVSRMGAAASIPTLEEVLSATPEYMGDPSI